MIKLNIHQLEGEVENDKQHILRSVNIPSYSICISLLLVCD
jgi:hypothetical protein